MSATITNGEMILKRRMSYVVLRNTQPTGTKPAMSRFATANVCTRLAAGSGMAESAPVLSEMNTNCEMTYRRIRKRLRLRVGEELELVCAINEVNTWHIVKRLKSLSCPTR